MTMGRDERDVIVVERDGSGGLKWLVLGAALGAGLALLFAPKTGKELRREIGKGIRGVRDLADETLDELKLEFGAEDTERRSMADDGGVHEDADDSEPARPARPRMVGAREELERRLEAARARRRGTDADTEEPVA